MATHKALVLHKYGDKLQLEDFPKPVPKAGEFLIKVQGSTVNPSDRYRLLGYYMPVSLPAVMGLEGTGHVVEANGEEVQGWLGKRVSFTQTGSGSWGEFATSDPSKAFVIDEEVPLQSAASGVVNPLTTVGMTDIFEKTPHKRGIIHSAAGSVLGRMLSKRCKTLGIPLLNIVRKQQHAGLLKSEGAQHVIVTNEGWEKHYAEAIQAHGFNVFFDALGGGPITEALIVGLPAESVAHIYGRLEGLPLEIKVGLNLSKGITITGYMLFGWYGKLEAHEQQAIQKHYSEWLKHDLATPAFKTLHYSHIQQALELSVSHTAQGKVTLVPN